MTPRQLFVIHYEMIYVTIRRPGRAPFRRLTLDDMICIARINRTRMGITREELKAKRLKAMSAVGAELQATADMYDRITVARENLANLRDATEQAHMADIEAQRADLQEMAEELLQDMQAVPTPAPAPARPSPALASATSEALAVLNATQPHPRGWDEGNAYEGVNSAKG